MKTNLEHIGAGTLWGGHAPTRLDHPAPLVPGTPVGQHLTVVRPVRLAEGRALYLVDNHSTKWNGRYCWNCGHKYSPNSARCCDYCQTPLRDLSFLMSARWDPDGFEPFQQLAELRVRHRGVLSPCAILIKQGQMLVVHHYNDESLLVDVPSPVPAATLLRWAYRLADAMAYLHHKGVVLGPVRSANVAIMPDGSARWWDLDVVRVERDVHALRRHPDQPMARDVRGLGRVLLPFADPLDPVATEILREAAEGAWERPYDLCDNIAAHMGDEAGEVRVPAAALSDVGLARAVNEDSWAWLQLAPGAELYAVADGMGGHDAGDVASQTAIRALATTAAATLDGKKPSLGAVEQALVDGIQAANAAVLEARAARPGGSDMGTTMVVAGVVKGSMVLLNAGDSRAYLSRGRKLQQLTQDHSVVAEMLAQGKLTPEQAADHPLAHTLLVWVGGEEELDFDRFRVQLKKGDRLLLCSDGLTDAVDDERIGAVLSEVADRDEALMTLLRDALYWGGPDNTTMVLVDF